MRGAPLIATPPTMARLPLDRRGYPVPYVAERAGATDIRETSRGPVLYVKHAKPERPRLGKMDPARQRECMLEPRCQVCHRDLTGARKRGDLWMAGGEALWTPPDQRLTGSLCPAFSEPPACLPCMRYAIQVCPSLVAGHAKGVRVYRVRERAVIEEKVGISGQVTTAMVWDRHGMPVPVSSGLPGVHYFNVCALLSADVHTPNEFLEAT